MIGQADKARVRRPGLVVAHTDEGYAALIGRSFRKLGWEVHLAHSGPEARRLARVVRPAIVVLDAELTGESGWLTCDKLTREQPSLRVILTGPDRQPQRARFATFVGAAGLVCQSDGVQALVTEVCSRSLPAVG